MPWRLGQFDFRLTPVWVAIRYAFAGVGDPVVTGRCWPRGAGRAVRVANGLLTNCAIPESIRREETIRRVA